MPGEAAMIFKSVHLQTVPAACDHASPHASPATAAVSRPVSVTVQPGGLLTDEPAGRSAFLAFSRIEAIEPGPYRLTVRQIDRSTHVFSHLGYDYEPFLFQVYQAWNSFVSRALYVDGPVRLEVKGRYALRAPAQPQLGLPPVNVADDDGSSRFRIHDASLLILPQRGPLRRIPLCFVDTLERDGLAVKLRTVHDEQLSISWLGHDADPFHRALETAIRRQAEMALELLQSIAAADGSIAGSSMPGELSPSRQELQAAAWLLRDGRGTGFPELQAACPTVAAWIDRTLRQWSPEGYYAAIRQLADDTGGTLMLGIRREQATDALNAAGDTDAPAAEMHDPATDTDAPAAVLRGPAADSSGLAAGSNDMDADLDGQPGWPESGPIPAFWLAVALPGARPALLVEQVSARPLAQATYVFSGPTDPADWPVFLQTINRGLEAVNFRRQPIHFPLERLQMPAFQRDLAALRFCPHLAFLRARFRGRIIHRGLAGWRASLTSLLDNN